MARIKFFADTAIETLTFDRADYDQGHKSMPQAYMTHSTDGFG